MEVKKNTNLPIRLNVLFIIVFFCFSILVIKLGTLQIIHGEDYRKEVTKTENYIVSEPVPRGKIYDRYGRLIVDNQGKYAITYIRSPGLKNTEVLSIARKLSKIIHVNTDKLTERDLMDYWILTRPDKAKAKLTKAELGNKKITSAELYKIQLSRINAEDLSEIKMAEKNVAAIYREMTKDYVLTPQIIKNIDVTTKEVAVVSEHLHELPGVDVITDWDRIYPNGGAFRSILGNISSPEEGLPSELLSFYLAKDYNRNDRVGKSQIEYQYEDVLRGGKAKTEYSVNQKGKVEQTKVLSEGQMGKDLVLTVDLELQKQVEAIVEKELISAKQNGGGPFLDSAFVVITNPRTGEILALSGKKLVEKDGSFEVTDFALGTYTSAYAMGSVVKGATILTGYQTGRIAPNTYLIDEPLYLDGTPVKKSYQTMNRINDLEALKRSSNVYMFKTAIRILGSDYYYKMKLPSNPKAFDTFKYYFNQFGLGVRTGIDLPNESIGVPGENTATSGLLLDFAIGQFATYTPLQLAQYVSTIANDGYRVKLQMVKEIREPSLERDLGKIIDSYEPVILNRIDMKDEHITRVQEGFRQVFQESGGTATSFFNFKPYSDYKIAGKTGTAQSNYYDPIAKRNLTEYPSYNLTLVGYAPFDQPEVAFSIVVPYVKTDKHPVNKLIGQEIMKAYFDLKNQNDF
ncbi:peptidoglycan D,D-transpeptidase FtsI family protein [Pseudoneobacillus sp. C159]